jgi:hypothetical protein
MACSAQVITPTAETWARLSESGPAHVMQKIKARHDSGAAVVLRMSGDASGLSVVWAERTASDQREIVAALGVGAGAAAYIPWLIEFGEANSASSIRTHCKRPGLIRIYERFGFRTVKIDEDGYTVLRFKNGQGR